MAPSPDPAPTPLAGSVAALGIVSAGRLRRAEAKARREGRSVEAVLVDQGALSGDELLVAARHRWTEGHLAAEPASASAAGGTLFGFPASLGALVRRARMARATRILATALMTMAVVVASEVAVTVLWGEPLSALMATRSQAEVTRELDLLADRFAADVASARGVGATAARRERAAERRRIASFGASLSEGEALGRIEIPAIGLSSGAVEGTGASSLAKGPGHFPGTAMPGQGEVVGIAGHRTTYLAPFRRLSELAVGDPILVEMPYGRFTYRVTAARVVEPDASSVVAPRGFERLVLTTCHPAFSAAERYVVFARRSGTR